jgi:hypothetical protein
MEHLQALRYLCVVDGEKMQRRETPPKINVKSQPEKQNVVRYFKEGNATWKGGEGEENEPGRNVGSTEERLHARST